MTRRDYWAECIATATEECGLTLTNEQLQYLVDSVDGADENRDQAFPVPSGSHRSEVDELRRQLKREKEKVFCPSCAGKGYVTEFGGSLQSTSSCSRCHGEGRVNP